MHIADNAYFPETCILGI